MKYKLSKSSYIRGLQCQKSLYLYKHHYDWQDEISGGQEAIFATGTELGILARGLFPGGIDLSPDYIDDRPIFSGSIKRTKEEFEKGADVIYEAAFVGDEVLAAVDILVKCGKKWKIYEVKSGGQLSDAYVQDACLQYYVLTKAGIPISDVSVVYVNKEYVRKGELEIKKLLKIESVLSQAKESFEEIGRNIRKLKRVIEEKSIPEMEIGPHCSDPYDCSFSGTCWKDIPEYSVFNISRIGPKAWDLHAKKIVRVEKIPASFPLNEKQRLEVECYKKRRPHVVKEAIQKFLNSLKYPLYFFDFETFNPVIPLFQGTSPYQVIPFQYSLHKQNKPGKNLNHFEFLGDGKNDPREALIKQFLKDTEGPGNILTYTSYEKTQLNKMAESFTKYASSIRKRIARLVDMSIPFGQKAYYSHKMQGSYSIKAVYPALVPNGKSYDNMPIGDGGTASEAYASLAYEPNPKMAMKIRRDLLAYCKLDTLAMVKILNKLNKI